MPPVSQSASLPSFPVSAVLRRPGGLQQQVIRWLAALLFTLMLGPPALAQERQPVIPTLGCILMPATTPGLIVAQLGYINPNAEPVELPIGQLNFFSPTPINRGQPARFLPGAHHNQFLVEFSSDLFSRLRWVLDGNRLDIEASAPRCQSGALALSVSGAGRVHTSDGALDCETTCVRGLVEPATFGISATAAPGWRFERWDGDADCADATVGIEVGVVRSCRARFEPGPSRAVAVAVLGPGQVAMGASGPLCPAQRCVLNLGVDVDLTLVTLPEAGARFEGWSGDEDCLDGTVDGPQEAVCVARFGPLEAGIFESGFEP